jgi:uncharacterized metal-binding protein YceD (DUF177 family)
MSAPLPWTHRTTEIPEAGLKVARSATAAELEAATRALGILSCDMLSAEYLVKALGEGRFRMTGKLSARVTQACVVTLEPVEGRIQEQVDVTFWPSEDLLPGSGEGEAEVLGLPEIEPIVHGEIEVGRVLFEILSASLDPYPRKPGARFEWEDVTGEKGPAASGPFAALKTLKNEP